MTRSTVLVVVLAACGGSHAAIPDAPVGAIDAAEPVPDAALADAALDAPVADARPDAPPPDAPPPLPAGWSLRRGTDRPGFRYAHAMVYDGARGQIVMFGGDSGPPYRDDTWVFDGFSWIDKTPFSASPEPRGRHAMAFDSARGRVVLYGGRNFFFDKFPETWEWDGATWTKLTPESTPPPLFGAVMAYDVARAQTILFGGSGPLGVLDETWAWNGTTWTKLSPGASPVARTEAAAVYDPARQRIVLFGGASQIDGDGDGIGDVLGDTWEWDGTAWLRLTPAHSPSPRFAHAMAYDPNRSRTVLFAGSVSDGRTVTQVNDTWEWNGTDWELQRTTTQPGRRANHGMAFHPARGGVFVYAGIEGSGISADLWSFTGL